MLRCRVDEHKDYVARPIERPSVSALGCTRAQATSQLGSGPWPTPASGRFEPSNTTAERPADERHREKANAYAHTVCPARQFPPEAEYCGASSQSNQRSDNVELKLSVDLGA